MRKSIKVEYKNLGKQRKWGLAYQDENRMEIDPRAKGKKHLELMNHEGLHILCPYLTEDEIVRISTSLTDLLWGQDYRRADISIHQLLQDGKP